MRIIVIGSNLCCTVFNMGLAIILLLAMFACGSEAKDESHPPENSIEDFVPIRVDSVENGESNWGADSSAWIEGEEGSELRSGDGFGGGAGMGPADGMAESGNPQEGKIDSVPFKRLESKGSLAFYCPKYMIENTACNVSLIISKDSLEKVKKLLSEKMLKAVTNSIEKSIKKDIEAHSLTVYEKMKVELKFDAEDFDLLASPQNETVVFNQNTNQREWDWVVKPKKPGNLQLILIVSAYSEKEGVWIAVESPPRIFNIGVNVDPRGYLVKLWGFFGTNPEWLFMQVFFPVIAFFTGRKIARKRK